MPAGRALRSAGRARRSGRRLARRRGRGRGRVGRSACRVSQTSATNPRARAVSSCSAPGPVAAVTAPAASAGSAGTRPQKSVGEPAREGGERGVLRAAVYQAQLTSAAHAARSVVFPKPACATTVESPASRFVEQADQALAAKERRRSPGWTKLAVAVAPARASGTAATGPGRCSSRRTHHSRAGRAGSPRAGGRGR